MEGILKNLLVTAIFCTITTPIVAQNLTAAVRSGDLKAVREALPEGTAESPDQLERPLYFASQSGHEDVVRYLLDHDELRICAPDCCS